MSDKKVTVNPMKNWEKPKNKAEVEKLLLKNLDGFARKGATLSKGFFPTGHFNLDFAITQGTLPIKVDVSTIEDFNPAEPGGAPRGRVIEVFGEPGGGKSSTCLRIVGNAQKRGAVCMWFDKEQSFVDGLAKINGVDIDELYKVEEPSLSAEETFDKIYIAMQSGVDLIVVDSVPALIPKAIMENEDSTKDTVALLARVMSKCVPKLTSIAAKTGCTVIFINQVRVKPGVMYGPAETTPGGETLKFFASLRLQINKRYAKDAEVWREDENGILQLVAQESLAFIRKTRYSKGLREGIPINIYFEPYFPNPEQVAFDVGRQTQTIKVKNGVFYWKYGEAKGDRVDGTAEGRKSFIDQILGKNLLTKLISIIKKDAIEAGIVLPPELTNFKIVDQKEVVRKEAVETDEARATREALEADALRPQENPSLTGVSGVEDEAPVLKRGKKLVSKARTEDSWTEEGSDALRYLREERGLSDESIQTLRYGYIPFRAKEAVLERLKFDVSGRVVMPVLDAYGEKIVFLSTRDIRPDCPKDRKHLHESVRKGQYLYGLHAAKQQIIERGAVIIVEGQFDAAYLRSIGLEHSVAILGTALTYTQAAILSRYCSHVYLLFDGDKGGHEATSRTMKMYHEKSLNDWGMTFVPVETPDGKDPDDLDRRQIISLCKQAKQKLENITAV